MSNSNKVYRMAGLAILTALIVTLQIVTTYFPVKPFAITLALIPIVIGSALYGAKAGAYLGAVFSVVVTLMCVFGVDVGGAMVWNANPFLCALMCMLKGTLAGFCSGLVYNALAKKNSILAAACAAVVSPVVNTGVFILGMMLLFKPLLEAWAGGSDVIYYALTGLAGINFIIELGVNIILVPVVVQVVNAVRKNKS